jgi:ribosomal protein S18 acetylase RimI-like enzyme
MDPNQSIPLVASQKEQVSLALAAAFQDDPAYRYILPDSDRRSRSLRGLFGAVVGYSLRYGQVYTTPAGNGAACWLTPGNTEITLWRALRTGMGLPRAVARFPGEARRRFLEALAYMDEVHKRLMTGPHWYLWALGVEPSCQGQGIGRKLLQPGLARSDAEGVPCYLETQTERNAAFYRKRGFVVVNEGQVPGQGLPVWMMLREPRQ